MQEVSAGKDSMDGHWEMMGLPVTAPLGFFPEGFPADLIAKIEEFSGRKVIVNRPISGTKVIAEYGEEQLKTGALIVYTSGDSVLQIAAHTAVIPLAELYRICEFVRKITIDEYHIGRIIARPYVGKDGHSFKRTADRHDYTLIPSQDTVLDKLKQANFAVIGIGKTNDIFSGKGMTQMIHTTSNDDGMIQTINISQTDFTGLCFINLVDFDAMYGHRRDPQGYGEALQAFDRRLGELLPKLKEDDLLMITADHGNDPGFKGTDHTREYVPLLAYSPSFLQGSSLGIRKTYADLGATILENFELANDTIGTSFLDTLMEEKK
ncbi:phosphopentomutase [Ligilactobacillus apodemi DSM 16634 = JCM 16172]|uniref:Phosphopentomutase n=1 Tax=Ligilactobacillus apodemi DSM 16634 = JCM 16172 TaxID=1423724 RepID=A0A0R1U0B7_9LACO|nr:phosphopentomutase [Ligilactobacillus apodemi DSM 16634 = JCM 16172]